MCLFCGGYGAELRFVISDRLCQNTEQVFCMGRGD